MRGKLFSFSRHFIPILLVSPTLFWVALDRYPFGGDQSHYGSNAIELFYFLAHEPSEWCSAMMKAMLFKAPGLVWLGQFFVPLSHIFGSIDKSLLWSILITQAIVLTLMYKSLQELTSGDSSVAILGCLIIAAAPLFIHFSHEFMVEPLQTLGTSYFILLMTFAPKWNRGLLLSHLLLATATAMLAKATSPLYSFGPGLVVLSYVVWPRKVKRPWGWLQPSTLITLIAGVILSVATIAWYHQNFSAVSRFVSIGSSGSAAAYWGKDEPFVNSILYWLGAASHGLFLQTVLVATGTICAFGAVCYFRRDKRESRYFTLCACIAILQIASILIVFSLNTNRETRFLLPSLPYFSLVFCWSVMQIRNRKFIYLTTFFFTLQFAVVHACAWGIMESKVNKIEVRAVDRDEKKAQILDAIVSRTCSQTGEHYFNILGIDPLLKGDWLGPLSAHYVYAKKQILNDKTPIHCKFTYLGGSFFGANATRAWDHMLVHHVNYFVTIDTNTYPLRAQVYNRSLGPAHFPEILEKVRISGFELEPRLAEDRGILIFKRTDGLKFARALFDRGYQKEAAVELEKVTNLESQQFDFWALLALTHERLGKLKKARAAAIQALQIKRDDYAVNSQLARILYRQKKWLEAIGYAEHARLHSPDEQEHANILGLMARIYLQKGDTRKACDLFRQIIKIRPDEDTSAEMTKNGCLKHPGDK